jgi:hypothetical protein
MRFAFKINGWQRITALVAAVVVTTTVAHAQSTDMNHPTRMTLGDVKGVGEESERQYYYTFTGGPGEVVVVLDVRSGSAMMVEVTLLDPAFKPLLKVFQNSGQTIDRVNIPRGQPVIMQVTAEKGSGSYRVRLTGAVKFADSSTPAPAATTPVAAAPATTDNRLGCIPKSGILRIEMEDGSAQEINLARARRVFVKP